MTFTFGFNGSVAIRVVQWATGGVGKAAIEGVLAHPDLELVGAWVHSDSKHGKDVGELVGLDPIGVVATTSAAEILAGGQYAEGKMYYFFLKPGRSFARAR